MIPSSPRWRSAFRETAGWTDANMPMNICKAGFGERWPRPLLGKAFLGWIWRWPKADIAWNGKVLGSAVLET
jgi:hypothetical protein